MLLTDRQTYRQAYWLETYRQTDILTRKLLTGKQKSEPTLLSEEKIIVWESGNLEQLSLGRASETDRGLSEENRKEKALIVNPARLAVETEMRD
jgi:hypothetical protein